MNIHRLITCSKYKGAVKRRKLHHHEKITVKGYELHQCPNYASDYNIFYNNVNVYVCRDT